MQPATGIVYLVGAGPGDPELLTLKAARLLAATDVVVYDRIVHRTVLDHVRPHARLIYVGKEGGGDSVEQHQINETLIAQARLGRMVVRLKGGDPFVFGRGAEEALALEAAGIVYEVVAGVSSGIGAPSAAAIPLTHRGVSRAVTFATAATAGERDSEAYWQHLAGAPTLVLFMACSRLEYSTAHLIAAGAATDTPAAIVEAGTWEHQRVVEGTLATIAEVARAAGIGSPALLIVGRVVELRAQLPTLVQRALGEQRVDARAAR